MRDEPAQRRRCPPKPPALLCSSRSPGSTGRCRPRLLVPPLSPGLPPRAPGPLPSRPLPASWRRPARAARRRKRSPRGPARPGAATAAPGGGGRRRPRPSAAHRSGPGGGDGKEARPAANVSFIYTGIGTSGLKGRLEPSIYSYIQIYS